MFDEPFRARFAPVVRPAARALVRAGVTPNQITVAAFLLAATAALLVGHDYPQVGLAIWLASRVCDGLDGLVAREGHSATPFGGYLDITLDMAGYAAMVLGFAALHPALPLAWASVLAGYVLVITTTLALSDAAGTLRREASGTGRTFHFTPGLTEAGETTAMYIGWVLLPSQVWWLVWVWVGALAITSLQRTLLAWRVLK